MFLLQQQQMEQMQLLEQMRQHRMQVFPPIKPNQSQPPSNPVKSKIPRLRRSRASSSSSLSKKEQSQAQPDQPSQSSSNNFPPSNTDIAQLLTQPMTFSLLPNQQNPINADNQARSSLQQSSPNTSFPLLSQSGFNSADAPPTAVPPLLPFVSPFEQKDEPKKEAASLASPHQSNDKKPPLPPRRSDSNRSSRIQSPDNDSDSDYDSQRGESPVPFSHLNKKAFRVSVNSSRTSKDGNRDSLTSPSSPKRVSSPSNPLFQKDDQTQTSQRRSSNSIKSLPEESVPSNFSEPGAISPNKDGILPSVPLSGLPVQPAHVSNIRAVEKERDRINEELEELMGSGAYSRSDPLVIELLKRRDFYDATINMYEAEHSSPSPSRSRSPHISSHSSPHRSHHHSSTHSPHHNSHRHPAKSRSHSSHNT